jgi:hypothetical protein
MGEWVNSDDVERLTCLDEETNKYRKIGDERNCPSIAMLHPIFHSPTILIPS